MPTHARPGEIRAWKVDTDALRRRIAELEAENELLRADEKSIRVAALEEAAKAADSYSSVRRFTEEPFDDEVQIERSARPLVDPRNIAAAIRALKDKP